MVNINRHNYETFFLLYVDGELSAAEKLAVEQFAHENTDLATELAMLQQTLLQPDEQLVFEHKAALYRAPGQDINTTNYEEYFLNYIDGELTEADKDGVEKFVLQQPALQETFSLLKQTKLTPETIVFPDKSILYRKEEKPVIPLRWWKVAAAAAVIGLGLVLWTVQTENENIAPVTAHNLSLELPGTPTAATETHAPVKKVAALETTMAKAPSITTTGAVKSLAVNTMSAQPVLQAGNDLKNEQVLPPVAGPVEIKEEQIRAATNTTVAPTNNGKPLLASNALSTDIKSISPPVAETNKANTLVQHVTYKELNTDNDDEEKTLYVGSLELNKDKLRGFFRKATSLFKGKAARQEDEKNEERSSNNTRILK